MLMVRYFIEHPMVWFWTTLGAIL